MTGIELVMFVIACCFGGVAVLSLIATVTFGLVAMFGDVDWCESAAIASGITCAISFFSGYGIAIMGMCIWGGPK